MFCYKHINKPRWLTYIWTVCMYHPVNGYQIQRLFIFLRSRKSSCKILVKKTLNRRECFKGWKRREVFHEIFFMDSCVLHRNLNETSKNILFFCKYQISVALIFFNFSSYLHATEEPKVLRYILSRINFLSSHT